MREGYISKEVLTLIASAAKKQIPKKPVKIYIGIETDAMSYACPVCHYTDECDLEDANDRKYKYCPMCGQALDWEGLEQEGRPWKRPNTSTVKRSGES